VEGAPPPRGVRPGLLHQLPGTHRRLVRPHGEVQGKGDRGLGDVQAGQPRRGAAHLGVGGGKPPPKVDPAQRARSRVLHSHPHAGAHGLGLPGRLRAALALGAGLGLGGAGGRAPRRQRHLQLGDVLPLQHALVLLRRGLGDGGHQLIGGGSARACGRLLGQRRRLARGGAKRRGAAVHLDGRHLQPKGVQPH
jgi:hypothetical protein